MDRMKKRGKITNGLIIDLFKAYKGTSYAKFASYINAKKDQYDDGEEMSSEQLMKLVIKN